MKTKYILYLLFVWVAMLGCNDPKHITEPLHRAEVLMNEDPDSAWAVLNAISPDEMGQNRNRALYALLYTQAQDKTYRDETNDSLISVAVDYYRHTDDVRHKFLSFYYKGRVHFNAEDYLNATSYYMEAEQLADEVGDDYLVGLLYAELGRIYDIYYDYPKSLEVYKKAAECYGRAGKIRHRNYMWLNQSSVYRNMNEYDECEQLLQKILTSTKEEKDYVLVEQCLGDLTMLYIKQRQMSKAHDTYAELRMIAGSDFGSSSFLCKVAQMYASESNLSQAEKCITQGWERAMNKTDSINLYIATANIYSLQGKGEEAYQELMVGASMQTWQAKQALQQPILTVQRDFLAEKLEFEAYKLQIERIHRWAFVLLLFCISAAIIYWGNKWLRKLYRKQIRNRLQKQEADYKQALDALLGEIKEKDNSIHTLIMEFNEKMDTKDSNFSRILTKMENEIVSKDKLYHEYVQQVEKLQTEKNDCLTYFNSLFIERIKLTDELLHVLCSDYATENMKVKEMNATIEAFIKRVTGAKRSYKDLEAWVNFSSQNVMKRLRSEIKLSDEDSYRQACYHIAGYSVFSISILMGETKNKIYKRRDRIRKKIEELSPESMDLFVSYLF